MDPTVVSKIFLMLIYDIANQTKADAASQLTANLAAIGISIRYGETERAACLTHALHFTLHANEMQTISPRPRFSFVPFKLPVRACGIEVCRDVWSTAPMPLWDRPHYIYMQE